MKIKTSITLSEDVLKAVDRAIGESENRSAFIEKTLRSYFEKRAKETRDAKDLEILNRNSDRLNREAEDVLSYQMEL